MIQVIERSFGILELLAGGHVISLKELASRMELNKSTLCNILKTMLNIGVIGKNKEGEYFIIKEKILHLLYPDMKSILFPKLAHEYAEELSSATREAVTVSALEGNALRIIATHTCARSVVVVKEPYDHLNIYASASGKVILANLSSDALRAIFASTDSPGHLWPEIQTFDDLRNELANIPKDGPLVKENTDSQTIAAAMPIILPELSLYAAIGFKVPKSRFTAKEKKQKLDALKRLCAAFKNKLTEASS